MNDNSNPPPGGGASTAFLHLDDLVKAYEEADNEADRCLFLRGALRVLESVTERTHDALGRITSAMSREGRD
jgi:hypothetical protein